MIINVALPVWGSESWPSMPWSGYRMPVKTLTRIENQALVGTLTGDLSLSYSISGGTDASRFELVDGKTLVFITAPDYEFPSDSDGNNVYEVDVTLTNGTETVIQPFTIEIGDDGMTTQVENLQLALDQVALDVGTLQANLGDVSTLTTAGVSSAVGALNNIETRLAALEVDQVTLSTVNSLIASAKNEILGGASTAANTLGKIEALINAIDSRLTAAENSISTLTTTVTALGTGKASQADMLAAQAAITALQTQMGTGTVDQRISDAVNTMRDNILNGAGAAFDTLKELADLITANSDLITSLNNVAAGRVAFDKAQNLTSEQQATARTNIAAAAKAEFDTLVAGIGDTAFDFKARYIEQRDAAVAAA